MTESVFLFSCVRAWNSASSYVLCLCIWLSLCECVCACACVRVRLFVYAHVCVRVYVCVCCACVYVCVCVCARNHAGSLCSEWGGEVEIRAMGEIYNRPVEIYVYSIRKFLLMGYICLLNT